MRHLIHKGIWQGSGITQERYFFIDETGELTDVEPITLEIIHDFSGSFTLINMNVTGTIHLDHTPVNGIRNDHDILYLESFENSDEITMDWEVPSADTGTETWTRVPYTGSTDQAVITSENAFDSHCWYMVEW